MPDHHIHSTTYTVYTATYGTVHAHFVVKKVELWLRKDEQQAILLEPWAQKAPLFPPDQTFSMLLSQAIDPLALQL